MHDFGSMIDTSEHQRYSESRYNPKSESSPKRVSIAEHFVAAHVKQSQAKESRLRNLKIAQVNVYFRPFMVGGADWYVYNISKELQKIGHEIHVFTADKYKGESAPSEEKIEGGGLFVHRLPLRLDWSYRTKIWSRDLRKSLIKGSFDVIHTYDYLQWHSRVSLKASKEAKIPAVITVFDVHSMIPRSILKQIPILFLERFFARGILNSADRILVRAPNLIGPLEKMGAESAKILVTPSGVNDETLSHNFDGRRFRERYAISGSPLILCVSRLNPLKGAKHLICATPSLLKRFPKAEIVFVGPDQGQYSKYLRKLSRNLRVDDHVRFIGPIYDFKEKMEAYSSCDIFVLPSAYEGTSQAIFEAMACRRPIVSTKVGGIPFQIEDGKEGILVDYAGEKMVEELSEAMIRILEDKELATRLGRNAREKVQAFRYSVLAKKLEEIYEQIAR
jgi:glycosyltransferase involved in cell wall biosynthesis